MTTTQGTAEQRCKDGARCDFDRVHVVDGGLREKAKVKGLVFCARHKKLLAERISVAEKFGSEATRLGDRGRG